MDTATLTKSWASVPSPRFELAECWALGPFCILRATGEGAHTLYSKNSPDPIGHGDLDTLKEAGAAAWAQELSEAFQANVQPPYDAEDHDVETPVIF